MTPYEMAKTLHRELSSFAPRLRRDLLIADGRDAEIGRLEQIYARNLVTAEVNVFDQRAAVVDPHTARPMDDRVRLIAIATRIEGHRQLARFGNRPDVRRFPFPS